MQKLNTDVFLSSIMLPNKDWCKRDAFITADCDVDEYIYAHQIEASYVIVKKSKRVESFLKLWLEYACNPKINSDQENVLGKDNYKGYRENRHDQTALSLAAFKQGYIGHRGFSDSSEYRIFKKRKGDFGCWGYSDDEIRRLAYDEYTSKGFLESDYKRIIINCRARNQSFFPFVKSVFRSIRSAVYVDMHRQKDINNILSIYKGRSENEDKAGDKNA